MIYLIYSILILFVLYCIKKETSIVLILSFSFYLSGILFFPDSTLSLAQILLIIYLFKSFFNSTNYKIIELKTISTILILFIIIIFVTVLFRGSGIQFLGSKTWGGFSYITIISHILFTFFISKTYLNQEELLKSFKYLTILSLLPVVVEILFYFGIKGDWNGFIPTVISSEYYKEDLGLRFQSAEMTSKVLVLFAFLLYYSKGKLMSSTKIYGIIIFGFLMAGLSGHRISLISIIIFLGLLFLVKSKINKIKIFIYGTVFLLTFYTFIFIFVDYLPFPIQRSLSFLPFITVPQDVILDAVGSNEFRVMIWDIVLDEIKDNLLVGKGLTFSSDDYYWATETDIASIESFVITGNFHNGPLSLLIGFGFPGLILFILIFSISIFKLNNIRKCKWNNPILENYFIIFYCYYIVEVFIFIVIYGDLNKKLLFILILYAILKSIIISDRYSYDINKTLTS